MKNILYQESIVEIKHLFRMMRNTLLALFVFAGTAFATESYSQTMKVTVVADNVSTGKVISEIEKQTDYLFVYNFTPDAWPVGNPETGYRNCDDSPTKSFLLRKFDKWYGMSFGKRPQIMLYDIKKDRACLNNLAADPAYAQIVENLQTRLFEELKKDGDFRALGQDTSWLDKVPWTGNAADVGAYDAFIEESAAIAPSQYR